MSAGLTAAKKTEGDEVSPSAVGDESFASGSVAPMTETRWRAACVIAAAQTSRRDASHTDHGVINRESTSAAGKLTP